MSLETQEALLVALKPLARVTDYLRANIKDDVGLWTHSDNRVEEDNFVLTVGDARRAKEILTQCEQLRPKMHCKHDIPLNLGCDKCGRYESNFQPGWIETQREAFERFASTFPATSKIEPGEAHLAGAYWQKEQGQKRPKGSEADRAHIRALELAVADATQALRGVQKNVQLYCPEFKQTLTSDLVDRALLSIEAVKHD